MLALPHTRRISAAVRWVVGALEDEMKDALARGDRLEVHWLGEERKRLTKPPFAGRATCAVH
ncbi:MAG: hypothetical protein ABWY02_00415 [Telluria sp.]